MNTQQLKPIAKVINNNQIGWKNIIETEPNVTLDIGEELYTAKQLATATQQAVEERDYKYNQIILWLLGYHDFPERAKGEGAYYWRTHLINKLKNFGLWSEALSKKGSDLISSNPNIMNGKPCITGTRIPITSIQALIKEVVIEKYYPQLTIEQIAAALSQKGSDAK